MVEPDKTITIASYLFLCLLFVALGLWTKHKPFMALLIALSVYVGIYLTSAILEPTTFVSGLLIKIVVVALLVRGMRNAKAAEELKKTFNR
jgi:energy-converting hydrogenase Eha subunit B